MTYKQQQIVMVVDWVSNPWRWNQIMTTSHLRLRGADSLFEQLTTEANRLKKIEISGMLSSSQTLDMTKVTLLE